MPRTGGEITWSGDAIPDGARRRIIASSTKASSVDVAKDRALLRIDMQAERPYALVWRGAGGGPARPRPNPRARPEPGRLGEETA